MIVGGEQVSISNDLANTLLGADSSRDSAPDLPMEPDWEPLPGEPTLGTAPPSPAPTSGYKVELDKSGAIVVSVPERSRIAKAMDKFPGGAIEGIALNPIIVVRREIGAPERVPDLISHEREHIYQQRALGSIGFAIAYGVGLAIGALLGNAHDMNPLEVIPMV